MADLKDGIRESVRERYAAAATAGSGCGDGCGCSPAGFEDVEVRPTHHVHEHASSAIIRAHKP
jgi:hypothetical protein